MAEMVGLSRMVVQYNIHFHSSLQMTLFEALYRYRPPQFNIHQPLRPPIQQLDEFLKGRAIMIQLLQDNLAQAQSRRKCFADKKRTEREFNVGDLGYLRLQPYRRSTASFRRNFKLAPKIGRAHV